MAKELVVKVPDIGDYKGVPVIDVLVKTGDTVDKETPLITLESDKATLDVPSPEAGVVKSLKLKAGDKVSEGDAVLVLEVGGGETKPVPAKEKDQAKPDKPAEAPARAKADKKEDKQDKQPGLPLEESADKKAAAPSGKTAKLEVAIPDIGDYKNVPVIEIMVKDGEAVDKAPLLTLELDKATLDVPAPQAGTVRGLKLKVGDKVSQGTPVCTLETEGGKQEAAGEKAEPAPQKTKEPEEKSEAPAKAEAPKLETPPALPAEPAKPGDAIPYASPAIRKFARELGVDLLKVSGSGPKGRITREDEQGFVKKSLAAPAAKAPATGGGIPAIPAVDFSLFGPVEVKPLARIRKLSAAHLHRAWLNVPHVTQTDEADITGLEAFRKAQSEENEASGKGPGRAALRAQGRGQGHGPVPRVLRLAVGRRREPGDEEVRAHRLRRRHAQWPGGAGGARRGQERHRATGQRDRRAGQEGPRGQAQAGRDEGRLLLGVLAGRHRRQPLHPHRQRPGSGHPRRVAGGDEAGVGRQGVPAAPDGAFVFVLRPPRDRRRLRRPLHRGPGQAAVGLPPADAMSRALIRAALGAAAAVSARRLRRHRAASGTAGSAASAPAEAEHARRPHPPRSAPAAPAAVTMNDVAIDYVKLVLALGERDPGYVDAYYGPAEWREQARRDAVPTADIGSQAQHLITALDALPPIPAWSRLC